MDLSDDLFGLLLFGEVDGQDAVFELGFDLVGLHAIGQVEGALEATVGALLAEELAFLRLVVAALFTPQHEGPLGDGQFEVLVLQPRQFGRDFVGVVLLPDVDARGERRVAGQNGQARVVAKEGVEEVIERAAPRAIADAHAG